MAECQGQVKIGWRRKSFIAADRVLLFQMILAGQIRKIGQSGPIFLAFRMKLRFNRGG